MEEAGGEGKRANAWWSGQARVSGAHTLVRGTIIHELQVSQPIHEQRGTIERTQNGER